jgi:polyisoprenyl-teichoic acid--peptidoglycan teichoic acid transferase
MASVRETWSAMSARSRVGSILAGMAAVVLVGALVGGGAIASGLVAQPTFDAEAEVEPTPVPPGTSLPPLPPTPTPNPSATPSPTPTPTPPGADPLLGTDGRLTVLLLGSDYRPAHPGNRTDAIMVVSIDPSTGHTAAFSIPRDTWGFPLVGGGQFQQKINALYQWYASTGRNAGAAMADAVGKAFGIEVDGYVLIGFSGVRNLVDAVGGVDVVLDKAYYDPYYYVTNRHQGWGLPAGRSHLNGAQALIFARSRKGDNDFGRARRQQILVAAALTKVRSRGPAILPKLVKIAKDTVRTDLPLARATLLFDVFATSDIKNVDKVVFGPKTYADGIGGSSFTLRLADCKRWIAKHFPPARPFGTWPVAPSPTPSPTPSASPGPTPTGP